MRSRTLKNFYEIKRLLSWQRVMALFALIALVAASIWSPLYAQSVTQGYDADTPLQRGMIVQLDKDNTTKVKLATKNAAEETHGVIVSASDSPATIAAEGHRFFVAKEGRFDVLVSTQSGEIKAGDYIAISAIPGIGMKAGDKDPVVVGRALVGFDGQKGVVSNLSLKDANGADTTVAVGRIETDISIAKNPLLNSEPNVPEVLRKASEAIVHKEVAPSRIYMSLVIFVISACISLGLLYGGVRSAIISIGRNPLSKKSILRGMAQVVMTGFIVFITGLFGVYLMLRL